jgi:hypothetical protein
MGRAPRTVAAAVTVAVLLGVVAVLAGGPPPPTPPAAERRSPVGGTLIYTADARAGWSRLIRWDLATNRFERGPRLRAVEEILDASALGPGWLAVTSRDRDLGFTGWILRTFATAGTRVPVIRGDLVAWAPDADAVAAVDRGPIAGRCTRRVAVRVAYLLPPARETRFERRACQDVVTVARDTTTTYLTLRRPAGTDVVYAGLGRPHRVLRDHALVSVSPTSDLIVVDDSGLPPIGLPRGGDEDFVVERDPAPVPVSGAASVYAPGPRSQRPIPYGSGDLRFVVYRVLAWSPTTPTALAVGRRAFQQGLYLLDTTPSGERKVPREIGPTRGTPYGTYTAAGTPVVTMAGDVFAFLAGRLVPLELPRGAPEPDGPLVWLP